MKKIILTALLFAIMVSASGCMGAVDISNQAFVTTIAVDKGENDKKFMVSAEIVRPALFLRNDGGVKAFMVESAEADSIVTALEEIQTRIPRLLSLSHLRVMLIGEELAKDNFRDTIEFIQKYPEKALRLKLMFVKGAESRELLKATPAIGQYIAEDLIAMSHLEGRTAMIHTNPLIDFIGDMRATEGKGVGTTLSMAENGDKIVHQGAAVFDQWKLAGWLNGAETKGANWLLGDDFATVLINGGGGVYAYCVESRKLRIEPKWNEQGELRFLVRLQTDGLLVDEQEYDYDLLEPENINAMEKLFSQEITGQIKAAIEKSQKEIGVDYLGFGENLKRHNPKKFKAMDWEKVYPNIPVDVEVRAAITRFGLSP